MASPKEVKKIAALLTEDPDVLNEQPVRLQDPRTLQCPNCGGQLGAAGQNKTCPHCDSPVSWTGARKGRKGNLRPGAMACPNCGAPWETGESACTYCGKTGRPVTKTNKANPTLRRA